LRAVDAVRTFPREPEGDGRVLLEVRDGVGTITIDRPERRNAMSFSIMRGLREAVAAARADDAVRVVVLTGAGDRAFCSGADLGGIGDDDTTARDARRLLADLFRDLWALGKPTIARVRGLALAGGLGIALACDIVVASEDAAFGAPEVSVGLWPYMITVPMLRSMPPKVALELAMTGRRVDAAEALRLGFVSRVVPVDALDATVSELAAGLVARSPLVLRLGRDAFYEVLDLDADAALTLLHERLNAHVATEDAREGLAAYAEKRAPRWTGR
jgi:enoyl-CoA hydratase/carnithine racemase